MHTSGSSVRVAVLDDHCLVRELFSSVLGPPEFEWVASAGAPEEFLQSVSRSEVNPSRRIVALLDVTLKTADGFNLPDGLSVMGELLKRRSDVAPLVISAVDDPDLAARCLASGAYGFLRK